jgi:hypothetical protein
MAKRFLLRLAVRTGLADKHLAGYYVWHGGCR